ncbi:hypothetical protein [Actinoplanes sp. NPDC051859]|uniref:hypothetical protein n=1 Tax=Actinoplanes sp. NPDC051859 TaxID=3363909 RepID=UPI0037B2C0AB
MIVRCRDATGAWWRWRVGRRRLAWLPGPGALELLDFGQIPVLGWLVALAAFLWWLLMWCSALLVTLIVWPMRAATGRWTVVARRLDGDDLQARRRVQGRAAADSLVAQWAAELERHGRLPEDV